MRRLEIDAQLFLETRQGPHGVLVLGLRWRSTSIVVAPPADGHSGGATDQVDSRLCAGRARERRLKEGTHALGVYGQACQSAEAANGAEWMKLDSRRRSAL